MLNVQIRLNTILLRITPKFSGLGIIAVTQENVAHILSWSCILFLIINNFIWSYLQKRTGYL